MIWLYINDSFVIGGLVVLGIVIAILFSGPHDKKIEMKKEMKSDD